MEWKGLLLWIKLFLCFFVYFSRKENFYCKNILVSRMFFVFILKNLNIKCVIMINNECFVEMSFCSWLILVFVIVVDLGFY